MQFFERHLPTSKHPEYPLRHNFLDLIKKYLDKSITDDKYITGLKDIVDKNGFYLAKQLLAKYYSESPRQSERKVAVAYYNDSIYLSPARKQSKHKREGGQTNHRPCYVKRRNKATS